MLNRWTAYQEFLYCPNCRVSLEPRGDDGCICPGCGISADLKEGGIRLDFGKFLLAGETSEVRKVGLAYRFYSMAYAPLALLNMLVVWRAGFGRLVMHYGQALREATGPVLDIAIGDGSLTRIALRLSGSTGDLIGLDISPYMLAKSERLLGGETGFRSVLGDAMRLPFASRSFRNVCCFGGFHVITHPQEALHEIARVLVPGGVLHASVLLRPRGRFPPRLADWYVKKGFLSTNFSREGFLAGCRVAGFSPTRVEGNGRMLLFSGRRE